MKNIKYFVKDFFDVNNIDHIKAYKNLEETGIWPVEFIPKDIEFENNWNYLLHVKLAEQWVKHLIEK